MLSRLSKAIGWSKNKDEIGKQRMYATVHSVL